MYQYSSNIIGQTICNIIFDENLGQLHFYVKLNFLLMDIYRRRRVDIYRLMLVDCNLLVKIGAVIF